MITWQLIIVVGISFSAGCCTVGYLANREIADLHKKMKFIRRTLGDETLGDTHHG